ncbi:peptidoglycan DD-metalloendopeptidase family protein [Acidobacteriota bacterium]
MKKAVLYVSLFLLLLFFISFNFGSARVLGSDVLRHETKEEFDSLKIPQKYVQHENNSDSYYSIKNNISSIAETFRTPIDGTWSASFDLCSYNQGWGYHAAEDMSLDPSTSVYSAANGVVKQTETGTDGYGAVVVIEHNTGTEYVCTIYGHLSTQLGLEVSIGQTVSKGDLIGYIAYDDEDGGSWRPHLHFGIKKGEFDGSYRGYQDSCDAVKNNYYNPTTDSTNGIGFIESHMAMAVISTSKSNLYFGATSSGEKSPNQNFLIQNTGQGVLNWSISDDASWLAFSKVSVTNNYPALVAEAVDGSGDALIDVSVNPIGLVVRDDPYSATITVSSGTASNSPQKINVFLKVFEVGGDNSPVGAFDTPINGSTVSGSVAVTGWALDDIEVKHVEIRRDPDVDDPLGAIGSDGLVHIGYALFVKGSRTDVEGLYPDYPLNDRAGWGYMLLTFGLPRRGNGNFKLYAYAEDVGGKRTLLGTKNIVADNNSRVKPFGAIDTPIAGQVVSGSAYINFGWALTPPGQTNKYIPYDGSTLKWMIDSVVIGNVDYGDNRTDIAGNFPECLNADTAGGHKYIDTTQYANGIHTIAWWVQDSGGESDGMGSRFFEIQNVGSSSLSVQGIESLKYQEDKSGRLKITVDGPQEIEVEQQERIEINFQGEGGKQIIGWGADRTKSLPIGSSLDSENGIFYWMPGPGFLNQHVLHFAVTDGTYVSHPVEVIVDIAPKRYKIDREQKDRKIKRFSALDMLIQLLLLSVI